MSRDTALPPGARAQPASRADVAGGTTEFQPSTGHSPAEVVKLPVKHADGPFGSVRPRRKGSLSLRRRLVAFDLGSVLVGWGLALTLPLLPEINTNDGRVVALTGLAVLIQLIAIAGQRLHQARVAARRAAELSGIARSALFAGLFLAAFADIYGVAFPIARIIAGGLLTVALLSTCRAIFSSWLRTQRALGKYARNLLLVGTNAEAVSLKQLLDTHPELGYHVAGITGDEEGYRNHAWGVPYLGESASTLEAVVDIDADGVLIAASAIDGTELNGLSRELLRHEVHVHLSSGLQGIDHRRLRPLPLAHEPLFYLERSTLSSGQMRVKRALDIVLSATTLLLTSPILIVAAIAIKINDGGPVLFTQRRVGRNCTPFTVYKLRTMVPDAEARLNEVLETLGNGRDNVLFKLDNDPRRTKVGRFLEATSLDELPQLFNVLNGSMSIVGPRPALPEEVAKFDDELMDRFNVPPGVTGLWQVEARDNPSFSAYRRLDLFYVENWNLLLDLVLMMETCSSVAARVLRRGKKSRS
ncbi:MAG TPA: sugar transferase [Microthrixaceae bacterium]|nr:sugar transferase [Microthrixaceae bacterium]